MSFIKHCRKEAPFSFFLILILILIFYLKKGQIGLNIVYKSYKYAGYTTFQKGL
jgi:hypothetical protein